VCPNLKYKSVIFLCREGANETTVILIMIIYQNHWVSELRPSYGNPNN
jgi:hypothetical protein